MQDPNHWYTPQRSNSGQHAYSIQDSASNTPTLPSGLHDNQALSSVYSFAPAIRPTQGENFSSSLDVNHSPCIPQCHVTFPIHPWSHIRLLMPIPNTLTRMAVTLLHPILLHTRSMQPKRIVPSPYDARKVNRVTGPPSGATHRGILRSSLIGRDLPPMSSVDDYMRPLYPGSVRIIFTTFNIRHIPLIHRIPLMRSSLTRMYPRFPIRHHLPRAYTLPLPHLHLRLTTVRFPKESSTLSRSPQVFSTTSSTSPAVSLSVRRQPSMPTHPPLRSVKRVSVYRDIQVQIPSNFLQASLSHRRSANP